MLIDMVSIDNKPKERVRKVNFPLVNGQDSTEFWCKEMKKEEELIVIPYRFEFNSSIFLIDFQGNVLSKFKPPQNSFNS